MGGVKGVGRYRHRAAAPARRVLLAGLVLLAVTVSSSGRWGAVAAASPEKNPAEAVQIFRVSPALFVENRGQVADPSVCLVHHGDGANVLLTEDGPVFQVFRQGPEAQGAGGQMHVFRVRFEGAGKVRPVGLGTPSAKFHYYRGKDPAGWHLDVPTYEKVIYQDLYPGIDLVVQGQRSHLKYEFRVAPGADPQVIRIKYEGVEKIGIDESGRLKVETPLGTLTDDAPYIYQVSRNGGPQDGVRVRVEGRFHLLGDLTYGIAITGGYDPELPLVIDPTLYWGTYLGGTSTDCGHGIATDRLGNVYVTGGTYSADFPTPRGLDRSYNRGGDAFVAKFNSGGTLLWSTFLGGTSSDGGRGIATDRVGYVYVTGNTYSPNFPTPHGWDRTLSGGDAFVAKFYPGGKLVWSTFLGGRGEDCANGICTDGAGGIYVTGLAGPPDFPTLGGWDRSFNGSCRDAFVAKFNSAGRLLWSTYLGGCRQEEGYAVTADASGGVYVAGFTRSPDFPAHGGWDRTRNDEWEGDAFVTKFTANGSLVWSTFLGGRGKDSAQGICTDGAAGVYVTGYTNSRNFPTTAGAWDRSYNGQGDLFVTKFSSRGALVWSTYLGGNAADQGYAIASNRIGDVCLTGWTASHNFPRRGTWAAPFNTYWGNVFMAKFRSAGSLAWSTLLTSAHINEVGGIAVDAAGRVYVTGATDSSTFPTRHAWDATLNGVEDAFVIKFTR